MIDRTSLAVLFGLLGLAYGLQCPKQRISPGREVVCYTSVSNVEQLTEAVCKCTTLVQQGYDVRNLSISDFEDFRLSLKEINPALQFAISVDDPGKTLETSSTVRREIIARLMGVLKEVDGVELNMTAGSKERLSHFVMSLQDELVGKSYDKRVFLVLPTKSEDLAKYFDFKELSKYVDLFTLPTHYLVEDDAAYRTFHPSRLMGLFDMFNADSLIDLINGLGAPKRKILVSVPASGYKFTLKDRDDNAPRAATELSQPVIIDQKQLCELLKNGEWTVERDEDLTGPYAFKDNTWIAFEDKISASIKGKYALLRELPGLAIHDIENDFKTDCGKPLVHEIHHSFSYFKRKSRAAVLNELESDLHQTELEYSTKVKSSDFRVVRVVDTEGLIRVVRENTQTEFTCARQGYFVHPKSCNRFYRCVKFNQEVEDYSVFEFDCPAGLSFDERTEVCVWPGSMPEGSPCPGSSEIAPVARVRFECPPKPGYYADPQNPRWFFACIDLGSPEMMAYEFRCPYGLIFDEQKLICEWPWLVEGYSGTSYTRSEYDNGGYGGTGSTPGTGGYYTGNLPHGYTGTTAGGVYSGSAGGSGYKGSGSGLSGSAGVGYSGDHGSSFGQGTTGSGYSGSGAAGAAHGSSFGQGTGGAGYSGSGAAGAGHGSPFGQGTGGAGYSGSGTAGGSDHRSAYGGQGTTISGYSGSGIAGAGHGSSFGQGTTGSGYSGSGAAGAGRGSSFGQGTTGSGYSGSGAAGAGRGSSFGQGTTGAGYSESGIAGGAGHGSAYGGQGTTISGYSGSGIAGAGHGSSFGQGTTGSGYSGSGAAGAGRGSSFGQGTGGAGYSGSGAAGAGHGSAYGGQGTTASGYSGSGITGAGHGSSFGQGTTGSGYSGSGAAGASRGSSFGQGTGGAGYSGSGTAGAGHGSAYGGQGTTGSGYSGSGAAGAGHGTSYGGQGTIGSEYSGSGTPGAGHESSFGQGTSGSGYSGSGAAGAGHGTSLGQGTTGVGYSGSAVVDHGSSYQGQGYSGTTGSGFSGSGGTGQGSTGQETVGSGVADHGSTGYTGTSGSGSGAAGHGISYGGQGSTVYSGTTGSGYSGSAAAGQGSIHGQGTTGYSGSSGGVYTGSGHLGSTIGVYTGSVGAGYSGVSGTGQAPTSTGHTGTGGVGHSGTGGIYTGTSGPGYTGGSGSPSASGHDYSGQGIAGHDTGSTVGGYPGSGGPGSTAQVGTIGGQPGASGTYGGFQGTTGTTYTGSAGGFAGATSGVHVGSTGTGYSGSTVGYAGSTAGTHITATEGYGGSDVKGGRYPGSSSARYPGSYPSSTPGSVSTDYSGPGSIGYPGQAGTKYTGPQAGSRIPEQGITYGRTHPSQTTIYVSPGITGSGVESTGVTSVHGQTRGPIFLDKPEPPKCPGTTSCSGTTLPSGGQTYVTNVYRGTGYTGGLNISLPGGQVPSIGGPTYHGAVTPSHGYGIPTGSGTGTIVTGHDIPGSIFTGDSTPGTIITYGNSGGSVISGSTDQGSIVTGGSHPGYTKTGSGTPGYTIGDGTKTVYPGSASPGTTIYGTPLPGAVLTGAPETGTVITGQPSPGIIVTGQTAPGGSIGGSTGQGSIVGSTGHVVYPGSGYQPQHGSVSSNIPYGTKIGTGSSTYDKTTGYKTNEYHDNGGRGTIKFNNGDVTTKYTENDIPDYRPTGGDIPPDILIPGIKIVPGASVPSGFTKTGPTKTGFTTATLGAGGSYVINTGHTRPTSNPDHIGPKAFEGNVAGYTKSSTESVAEVYPTNEQDVTRVDTSKITLGDSRNTGYSYPTPNIPFENGVTKHLPIASTEASIVGSYAPTPFLNVEVYNTRKPAESTFIGSPGLTSGYQGPSGFTKAPGIYTTRRLENYKTTPFRATKIPVGISTVQPPIDTVYKTIGSSTPVPGKLSHDVYDGYDIQTGSEFGFGTKTQQDGYEKGYVSSTTPSSIIDGVASTYSTKPQFNYGPTTASPGSAYYGSTTKFGQSVSGSPQPQTRYQPSYSTSPGVGVTYGKPLPDGTYQYSTPVPPVTSKTYIGASSISGGADYARTQSFSTPTFQQGYGSSTPASSGKTQSPFAVTTYSGGYSKPSSSIAHQSTAKSTAVGKPKVIVKWSDLHPLLLGKLGAECTCRGDPFADLKLPSSISSSKGKIDLLNYDASDIYVDLDSDSYEATDYDTKSRSESSTRGPHKISNNRVPQLTDSSSSIIPEGLSSTYLPSLAPSVNLAVKGGASGFSSNRGFRGSYRSGKSLSDSGPITDSVESRDSSIDWSETDDESDLTLDGATNCARPGLFRHPNFCNKFYACHWDEWKKKFTLHLFNCPVHLTFDNGVAACNWPSMGPACQDDNLLV